MRQAAAYDDTRNLHPAGMPREHRSGDGRGMRAGRPIRAASPEGVIGFDALWASMEKCACGVMWKGSAASFCLNGAESVHKLSDELKSGSYRPRKTTTFQVTSPKARTITSTPFRDRVYQRSLNDNALYPSVTRSLIHDNAACQKGKGIDFALERFKRHLRRHWRKHGLNGYALLVDVKSYYATLPHWLGESVFDRSPKWARDMAVGVLRGQYEGDVGYNPGSQMVQIVGIAALDGLDHLIKERLGVKGYIRYMDDFRLLGESKEKLEGCLAAIRAWLGERGLSAHAKKTRIQPIREKIPFLGFDFRLTKTGKVVVSVRSEKVKAKRRQWARMARLEARGELAPGVLDGSFRDWCAHAKKGNSHRLIGRCERYIEDLRRHYA